MGSEIGGALIIAGVGIMVVGLMNDANQEGKTAGFSQQKKTDASVLTQQLGINHENDIAVMKSGLSADAFEKTSARLSGKTDVESTILANKIATAISDCRARLGMDKAFGCSADAVKQILKK